MTTSEERFYAHILETKEVWTDPLTAEEYGEQFRAAGIKVCTSALIERGRLVSIKPLPMGTYFSYQPLVTRLDL